MSLINLFVYSMWALFAHTGILLPSFTHLNLFDVLSSGKHKSRSFKECSCRAFPYNENGWGLEKDKKAPQKHNKSSPYYFRSHRMIALCEKQTEIQSQH